MRRVCDLTGPECRQAMKIYAESFPKNETRPVADTLKMLDTEPYSLWVAGPAGEAHAFALTYRWYGFALLDYIAVERSRRGGGLGGALFAGTLERLDTGMLLLEVQNPDGIHAERDSRTRFWRRMGAVTITDGYVLPSYVGEPETMSLMAVLRGRGMPSTSEARRCISQIHRDVYGYAGTDLTNAATLAGVPP